MRIRIPPHLAVTAYAIGVYLLLALALTWPLARGLGRDVAWDLGDSLLNMWILAWDAESLKAILTGDFWRIRTFFDANIFHPEPRTLAYSEHLFAQAVQVFPIYLATGNPILCYNLLVLSTFVLCGLGTFLLVRDLTANTAAAFLAGLLFAFAPYRFAQASHLQVLSVQWMPFVLYGLSRYFETRRRRALVGGAAALVAQNLSCGYYLLYFAPLAGVYALWEITARGLWRNPRIWRDLSIAAVGVLACTLPFLIPYKQVRDSLNLSRDLTEVVRFSADVYSYFTAFDQNDAWGTVVRAFPKREGELFPGVVPLALAGAACALWISRALAGSRSAATRAVLLLGGLAVAHASLAAYAIFTRRIDIDLLLFEIRATNVTRLLVIGAIAAAAAVFVAPDGRRRFVKAVGEPEAIFLLLAALAWWLSLGPAPRAYGRPLDLWAPYALLFEYVPGYEGVRVPARLAMVVAFALAVLGGLVVARTGRRAPLSALMLGVAFLLESHTLPFQVNGFAPLRDFATPEARVYRPTRAPDIYRDLALEPPHSVVLEMPFGQPDYDVRAVYYSTAHWKKLVNGYSGFFPPHYSRMIALMNAASRGDEFAWRALESAGVTHVIVHEAAYLDDEGIRFSRWLQDHGAAEVSRRGGDVLFELPH